MILWFYPVLTMQRPHLSFPRSLAIFVIEKPCHFSLYFYLSFSTRVSRCQIHLALRVKGLMQNQSMGCIGPMDPGPSPPLSRISIHGSCFSHSGICTTCACILEWLGQVLRAVWVPEQPTQSSWSKCCMKCGLWTGKSRHHATCSTQPSKAAPQSAFLLKVSRFPLRYKAIYFIHIIKFLLDFSNYFSV